MAHAVRDGVLHMPTARYYWAIQTGSPTKPDEIRGGIGSVIDSRFPQYTSSPTAIKNDLARNPKVRQLIVWDSFDTGKGDSTDKILPVIGPAWQKVGTDELFYARDHWTWRDFMTVRRRVYVKVDPPATAPTTVPATSPSTSPIDK